MTKEAPFRHGNSRGYEPSDISLRVVVIFGIGLLTAAIVIHFAVGGLFSFLFTRTETRDVRQSPLAQSRRVPPQPRLQVVPEQGLRLMQEEQEKLLHSYQWVDRASGVVRIPIDRAMERLLEKGLPVRTGRTAIMPETSANPAVIDTEVRERDQNK
ncbi:MAG: hypothetical protein HY645_03455 [Acidobacteria bacterium]|nr:hypothetical protein [Acidobacteriota bacterium]